MVKGGQGRREGESIATKPGGIRKREAEGGQLPLVILEEPGGQRVLGMLPGTTDSEKEMVSSVEGMELEFGQVEFPLDLTGGDQECK